MYGAARSASLYLEKLKIESVLAILYRKLSRYD
jgi:hypothetical protein